MMVELRFGLLVVSAVLVLVSLLVLPSPIVAQAQADGRVVEPAGRTPAVASSNDEDLDPQLAWSIVDETVRAEIASRWNVTPGRVLLEWGPHTGLGKIESDTAPELVGNGSNGQWVVRLATEHGTVGVRVRAGSTQSVATAATPLRRGETIGLEDIRFEDRMVWGAPPNGDALVPNNVSPTSDLVGWTVQRPIEAGSELVEPGVAPPTVVRSGESVEVMWSVGAIRLVLMGRAVGTARAGETVAVRLETGKRVRGVAEPDGTVRVSQLRP